MKNKLSQFKFEGIFELNLIVELQFKIFSLNFSSSLTNNTLLL